MAAVSQRARARRYLQASMHAGYTGLPAEHREAYEAQMRDHERVYPRVREHALAGADQDFDEPLAAGEREHQRHLRRNEGMDQARVLELRRQLRNSHTPSRGAPPRPAQRRPSPSAPARAAAGAAGGALGAGITGRGNIVMQAIGIGLGLSLLYLLLTGKGVNALTGIAKATVGAASVFIRPEDPIAKLEAALGAQPASASSAPAAAAAAGGPTSAGAPSPTSLVPMNSAGGGHTARPPAAAGALTWPSLRRQIIAHQLTPAQVVHDENILLGKG